MFNELSSIEQAIITSLLVTADERDRDADIQDMCADRDRSLWFIDKEYFKWNRDVRANAWGIA